MRREDDLGAKLLYIEIDFQNYCIYFNSGPATVTDNRGNTILVGVASYVTQKCGPEPGTTVGVNNGQGTYINDSANYVDIYSYMSWITETMGKYLVNDKIQ